MTLGNSDVRVGDIIEAPGTSIPNRFYRINFIAEGFYGYVSLHGDMVNGLPLTGTFLEEQPVLRIYREVST